jgi:putative aldouronate transport system permease protein
MVQKIIVASGNTKKTVHQRVLQDLTKNHQLYLLVLVPLAILVIFKYVPMYGLQIAFRDFKITKGINSGRWVGLKYFQKFFSNPQAFTFIFNTLAISFYELCLFPLSLILALMLNYITSSRFKRTVQMVSYAPHFISVVVMCGLLIQFLQARIGLINILLNTIGIEGKNWLTYPTAFRDIYVWSEVWQHLGYGSIIYIASLAGVSPELHEAAIVDGASIMKRIWYIDIPSILPTFSILLIMRIGRIMDVGFQKVLLMQNNLNLSASEIISTYVYNIGLNSTGAMPQYSYGAAIGLLTAVVNLVMLVMVNRITRKLSGTGLW